MSIIVFNLHIYNIYIYMHDPRNSAPSRTHLVCILLYVQMLLQSIMIMLYIALYMYVNLDTSISRTPVPNATFVYLTPTLIKDTSLLRALVSPNGVHVQISGSTVYTLYPPACMYTMTYHSLQESTGCCVCVCGGAFTNCGGGKYLFPMATEKLSLCLCSPYQGW